MTHIDIVGFIAFCIHLASPLPCKPDNDDDKPTPLFPGEGIPIIITRI